MTIEEAIQYAEKKIDSASYRLEMGYLNNGLRQIVSNEYEFFMQALSAIRQQEHFREVTKKVEPLALDELVEIGVRAENGENIIVYCTPLNDWVKVFKFGLLFFGTEDYRSWPEIEEDYGKTWLAYRQKPEEDDHDERKENENV